MSKTRSRKGYCIARGGPCHGCLVKTGGTFVFRVGTYKGRYVGLGLWEDVQ